jgi:hypothetical protein
VKVVKEFTAADEMVSEARDPFLPLVPRQATPFDAIGVLALGKRLFGVGGCRGGHMVPPHVTASLALVTESECLPRPPPPPHSQYVLTLEGDTRRAWVLDVQHRLVVGRAAASNIVVPDKSIR